MNKRLEQAIAQLKTLPEDRQDAIATRILEELEDDQRWDESFTRSPDLLAKLATEAMADYQAGKTQNVQSNEIKPPKTFLQTAQSLKLQGKPDWSEKIDHYLYGETLSDND
jgi:hypothetical protein